LGLESNRIEKFCVFDKKKSAGLIELSEIWSKKSGSESNKMTPLHQIWYKKGIQEKLNSQGARIFSARNFFTHL